MFNHSYVCRKLTRNFILGRDFLRTNRLHIGWSKEGRFRVQSGKEVLIEAISVETPTSGNNEKEYHRSS